MKTAVVTGASGFIGYHLIHALQAESIFVYAVIRPNSQHQERLKDFTNIKIIELAMQDIEKLSLMIEEKVDLFYHLAWEGERNDFFGQNRNIGYTLHALTSAKKIGCRRFIVTGSQAEYGLCGEVITEEKLPKPNTAYGSAKLATCFLSKFRAEQLQIEWIWPRLFSVYGRYDNPKALIPYLIRCLQKRETPQLTKGLQNWDYLHASDAAELLVLLGEKGSSGEIYNIANGYVQPLNYFVEEIRNIVDVDSKIIYGESDKMIVSLNPSVEKIKKLLKWEPKVNFTEGIYDIINK